MRNKPITRFELMLPGRYEDFYQDLLCYLRQHLLQVPSCPDVPDRDLLWVCQANDAIGE